MVFDYFVANDHTLFPDQLSLKKFTAEVYNILNKHREIMPLKFQSMLPYMEQQNWLFNYRFHEGLERSLEGLRRRALYITESSTGLKIFHENFEVLQTCYQSFFPELKKYSEAEWRNLLAS